MKDKISILMPVYNGEKFIAGSIESILNQTYGNFEFIIIDDASSDNSFNIINSYKDSRIKLFRNDFNIGQTKTLNRAIKLSEGEFIARMDQDDIASKERLEEQLNFFKKHNEVSLLGTSVIVIDEFGKKIDVWHAVTDEEQLKLEILFNNPIVHSSVMLRKKSLSDIGQYNEDFILGQDYELWSRMLLSGYKIANIRKSLLFLRVHSNSATVNLRPNRFNIEVANIIKRNIHSLTGVNISAVDAERVCKALNAPDSLSDEEFEHIVGIFDRIFKKFQPTQKTLFRKLNKSVGKFKYLLALGYIEKDNLSRARARFFDAFKTYPYNFNPLIYCVFTLFGKKICGSAKLIKKYFK